MLFEFQLDASFLINEYLQNDKIIILSGEDGIGKKHIIKNLESDYDIYPIIENIYSIKDLYSQIIMYKNNSANLDLEFGIGQAIQFNIPVNQIFNKFCNFLKSDFDDLENKIISEFKSITKNNNVILPIQLYKNTSNRLIELICNEITKLNIKIILIINSEDMNVLKYKKSLPDIPNIIVEYNKESFYSEVSDILSKTDFDKIMNIASGKIRYVIEIYNYLILNPSSNYVEYTQMKFSDIKEKNQDAYILLEFLSYFESRFSIKEIKYIYDKLYNEFRVSSNLNNIVRYILKNNILKEDNTIYDFILLLFKQILRQNNTNSEHFYLTLGECIAEIYPLDLNMQLSFYSKANVEYTNIIRLFLVVRLARNEQSLDDAIEFVETIDDVQIRQSAKIIINGYINYFNSKYDDAIKSLSKIKISDNSRITNEANYLLALCYWKKSGDFKKEVHKILEVIVEDNNTFEETILLSKMALLSIYVNDAQYHNKNKLKLYNELKNYIREKIKKDNDYELLLNILKRKSNSVFPTVQCIHELESSFNYFSNNKFLFNSEFAMSLCNYGGALLNLGEFKKCVESYNCVDWESFKDSYKLYNFNNYILAEFFSKKNIIDINMMDFIKKFEKLIYECKISVDTKILTSINLAGLKVYEGKYDEANRIYNFALELNEDYDDYFNYFICTNICVIAIINNDYSKASEYLKKCNFVPEIFSTYEKQYIKIRNSTLSKIIKNKKSNVTIETISKCIFDELNKHFITNNFNFFGTGILFSDIQFWTDN